MINTQNIETAKKEIKLSKKPIIIKAQDENFNRKILEYGKFEVLLFTPELLNFKDKPKQLDSALNHVLALLATKNKVAIGMDLETLRNLQKKEKARILAKLRQNIKICRKAKTSIAFLNSRDQSNFLLSLGASTQQVKAALFY